GALCSPLLAQRMSRRLSGGRERCNPTIWLCLRHTRGARGMRRGALHRRVERRNRRGSLRFAGVLPPASALGAPGKAACPQAAEAIRDRFHARYGSCDLADLMQVGESIQLSICRKRFAPGDNRRPPKCTQRISQLWRSAWKLELPDSG